MKRSKNKLRKLNDFAQKTLDEKLAYIKEAWQKHYPEIFEERGFFETLMREYRYKKTDGWVHTADIAENFKGVDFYKGIEIEGIIDASEAVSMKTTKVKNVKDWLNSEPIKKNIQFLKEGIQKGFSSNNRRMIIKNAEIHIYIPKENIDIKEDWLKVLKNTYPEIEFKIDILEDFVK